MPSLRCYMYNHLGNASHFVEPCSTPTKSRPHLVGAVVLTKLVWGRTCSTFYHYTPFSSFKEAKRLKPQAISCSPVDGIAPYPSAGMASVDDVNFELPKLRTSFSLEVNQREPLRYSRRSRLTNTTHHNCRMTPGFLAVMTILQASNRFLTPSVCHAAMRDDILTA